MTRLTYYRAKNMMLLSTLISNLIGVAIVWYFTHGSTSRLSPEILRLGRQIDMFFLPASFLLPIAIILIYERPIRTYFKNRFEQKPLSAANALKARRRLLNEPFFLICLSFCMWLAAAAIYPLIFWTHNAGPVVVRTAFWRSLYTGLITITVAFFVLEFFLQRRVVPHVFPHGGLSSISGTLRIRIRTKLIAFLFACNIVPLVSILQHTHAWLLADAHPAEPLAFLQSSLVIEGFVFMAVGIWLTFLVSSNLTKPLQEITQVLRKVQNGLFETKVKVTSNDEIGYAGDVINAMTDGLVERDRMKQSLALAQEIQQNLFPSNALKLDGVEVAGKCVYCEETGGDYFDFIPMVGGDCRKEGVVIGDVSGHGISSALLMATVRSALRQRASHPGNAAEIISDVNRQLVQDIEHSGNFVTLFFLVIDTESKEIAWVRAGHDPALLYDHASDSFEEIGGTGIALGVDGRYMYREQRRPRLSKEQIILLGTDGIWEASDPQGKRFGKEAVYAAVRSHRQKSAGEIIDAVLDAQTAFQKGSKIEDDATLVILKVQL
jgi:phosphoserine phosphatase RsbU/P